MSLSLLQTKFYVPPRRPQLVPRPVMTAKLHAGTTYPLMLIAAPAGFGKTTVVSEWITQSEQPVTWLSLGDDDNDLSRFLIYLVAALRNVHPHIGERTLASLHTPQLPPLAALLTPLLNDLNQLAEPFALVLDDYHLITTPSIHEAMTFLVENLPTTLHIVLTTRVDPPLPLARWRVRNRLSELRAGDLRFTTDETTAFFNDTMGLSLSVAEIGTLEARTEGWIAALQLAALAMQQTRTMPGRQDHADFITAFTGSHRFVIDYLTEEVLRHQSPTVRDFLLATSILDRVCGALGDALTQSATGQATLRYLEQHNLLLVPLDDERQWYRYHHLFRDLLLQRLHTQYDATTINERHQRAAQWCAAHALTEEAIHHYLAAAAIDQAADLIEEIGYQLIGSGHLGRVGMWLDKLPRDLVRSRPRLILWQAWVLNLTGQPALLEEWLQETEINLQRVPAALAQDMRAQLITLHAYRTRRQGDFALAIAQLQQALADCAADNVLTRTAINLNLGFNYWMTGAFPLAEEALIATQREAGPIQAMHMVLLARGAQANVAVAQGKLRVARQLCEETIQSGFSVNGGRPFPSTGYAYAVLGNILYEQNELAQAETALQHALELGELMADGTVIRRAIFSLAPLRQLAGDDVAAQLLWQSAFATHDTVEEPQVALQQVRAWLVQAAVAANQDALTNAVQWATRYQQQQSAGNPYGAAFAETLIAWIELLQGQPAQALARLAPLIAAAAAAGQNHHLLQMLLLQTLAHAASGETTAAHTQLLTLLKLTAPEGYIRLFVDAGEPMRLLLSTVRAQRNTPSDDRTLWAYVEHLCAAFGPQPTTLGAPIATVSQTTGRDEAAGKPYPFAAAQAGSANTTLIEPLSDRELEILHLVADGLSNSAIAGTIIVTVGTVKKHLNNIYGKLGVSSRTQAIARGRELQLL